MLETYDEGIVRQSGRKEAHVRHFLKGEFDGETLFNDIWLEHQALPEINFNEIETRTHFLDKEVSFPLLINAMTGGYEQGTQINEHLARLACEHNIPMAVGSQTIALKNEKYAASFKVVRKVNPKGIVMGNVNGFVSADASQRAVEMIQADALQVHLNPAQEICMTEGDRDFRGVLKNIEAMVRANNCPIIVKEVGFGIATQTAKQLLDVGVDYIDVGGYGGTNFIKIEGARHQKVDHEEFYDWGIPTALSLLENCQTFPQSKFIASGGIRRSDELVKALIIGAKMVGVSGPILRVLLEEGYDQASAYLNQLHLNMKRVMLLLGKSSIQSLAEVPFRLKGELRDLVGER